MSLAVCVKKMSCSLCLNSVLFLCVQHLNTFLCDACVLTHASININVLLTVNNQEPNGSETFLRFFAIKYSTSTSYFRSILQRSELIFDSFVMTFFALNTFKGGSPPPLLTNIQVRWPFFHLHPTVLQHYLSYKATFLNQKSTSWITNSKCPSTS